MRFLGECRRQGLNSMLISKCPKCNKLFKLNTSQQLQIGQGYHFSTNIGAVLGQIATGGGSAHLEEQLACVDVPSISKPHFIKLEEALGHTFNTIVTQGLLSAGIKERLIATVQLKFNLTLACVYTQVARNISKDTRVLLSSARC